MKNKFIALAIVACMVSLTFAARVPLSDIQLRKDHKKAISLFMPWAPIAGGIIDTAKLHIYQKTAIHDLVHQAPEFYGLHWNTSLDPYPGNAETFTQSSIDSALQIRKKLLALNPNLIMIGEIRFYDAVPGYLPPNSPYWMRNGTAYVPSGYMDYQKLDLFGIEFQTHVANQCKALLETGVVDGIFLDWAKNDRYPFFKKIRDLVGDNAVLIGNVNSRHDITDRILPLFNGVYMESGWWLATSTADYYFRVRNMITMAQDSCRPPKLICTEVWSQDKVTNLDSSGKVMKVAAGQLNHMRAGLAVTLTHSSGYYSFYPQTFRDVYHVEHMHIYDDFFNAYLGNPIPGAPTMQDGAYLKDWEFGTVVFNPPAPDGKEITVTFPEIRRSQRTGIKAMQHTIPAYEGDIFLKGPYTQMYPAKPGALSAGLPALLSLPDTTYRNTVTGISPAKRTLAHGMKSVKVNTLVKDQQIIIQKQEEGAATKDYNTSGRLIKSQERLKK